MIETLILTSLRSYTLPSTVTSKSHIAMLPTIQVDQASLGGRSTGSTFHSEESLKEISQVTSSHMIISWAKSHCFVLSWDSSLKHYF
jgi:hypothetical protein